MKIAVAGGTGVAGRWTQAFTDWVAEQRAGGTRPGSRPRWS